MNRTTTLLDLQKRQNEHDKEHHPDIYNTSYPDRMNHYVLHFSKYVGRLSRDYDDEKELEEKLEKTVADALIVGLATANTLNMDLQTHITQRFDIVEEGVPQLDDQLDISNKNTNLGELQEWLLYSLATPTGRMSDAMESLDHMESMNARDILETCTLDIFSSLLIAASYLDNGPEDLIAERWKEIEENSIL